MPTPLFIAVGHHGSILSSRDGSAWDEIEEGEEGETYRAVAFGNKRFVAVGSYGGNNIVAASADGAGWQTAQKEARYVSYIRGLTFGKDIFLGMGGDPGTVGDSKPFITTSTDGLTWSENESIGGKNILRRAAFGNDIFVAVGDRGRRAASSDGRKWTDALQVKARDTLVDIAFGAAGAGGAAGKRGIFAGVGLHGLRMSSVDGVQWSEPQRGDEGEHLNAIVWAGDRFVAVGMGATWFSSDGRTWKREKNSDAPLTVAYGEPARGKGVFIGANWKGRLMRSTDAIQWKQVHQCEHHVEAVAAGS